MCHILRWFRANIHCLKRNRGSTLEHGTASSSIGSLHLRSFPATSLQSAQMSMFQATNHQESSLKQDQDLREHISSLIRVIAMIIKKLASAHSSIFTTANPSMNSPPNNAWGKKSECRLCMNRETDCQCILLETRFTRRQSINQTSSLMEA